jgi:hypothetical protein
MGEIVIQGLDFVFHIVGATAFIWLPIVLGYIALTLWHHYLESQFVHGIKWKLLEVRIPRDVEKSPQAMELILSNALYQATDPNWYYKYWVGRARLWFSLEMVSLEGEVHFYIRTPSKLKNLVETQIYAQYSQAEVIEVPDYAFRVPSLMHGSEWDMWGCQFALEKPDPFPVKTYIDYGLDKAVGSEEEQKIDPLTPTIELLGSFKRGEQAWIQILIRASKKSYHKHGTWNDHHGFHDEANVAIQTILAPYKKTETDAEGHPLSVTYNIPDFLKDDITAIKRKSSKLAFDTIVRVVYTAKKVDFNKENQRALRLAFRQYATPTLNAFKRYGSPGYAYPWQDRSGKKTLMQKEHFLDAYRTRSGFYPKVEDTFHMPWPVSMLYSGHAAELAVLNTEELATIFHFPGRVSQTTSFKRIDSKKSSPPSNLPI